MDPTAGPITYLFLHIPKTAGTSLRLALEQAIPVSQRALVYGPGELKGAITEADVAQLPQQPRLVYGHFHYGLHERLPWRCRYVTILREPVRRVASLYSMYTRTRPEWVEGGSLRDWALGGALQADNEMVRQVSGNRRVPFGAVDEGLLAQAIQHLDRDFAAVLVTERMDEGIPLLASVLSLPLPAIGRKNVGKRELVPLDAREAIEDLNKYDMELYRHAARRLEADLTTLNRSK